MAKVIQDLDQPLILHYIGLNVIQKHFSKSPILHQQIEVTSVFKCQYCQITSENYSDIIEHIANSHHDEMENNSNFDAKSILEQTRQVSNNKDDAFKEFRRLVSIGDLPKSRILRMQSIVISKYLCFTHSL